jgi:hypothetical protein
MLWPALIVLGLHARELADGRAARPPGAVAT